MFWDLFRTEEDACVFFHVLLPYQVVYKDDEVVLSSGFLDQEPKKRLKKWEFLKRQDIN